MNNRIDPVLRINPPGWRAPPPRPKDVIPSVPPSTKPVPLTSDDVEIEISKTPASYRRPRTPLLSVAPVLPPLKPKPPPTIKERIDNAFERHGLQDVGVKDAFKRFALLPDADQTALLDKASAEAFGRLLQRARPRVRHDAIRSRGHLVPGQRG
jgi:hypothetical protein